MKLANYSGYHDEVMTAGWATISLGHWDTQFDYTFENYFHPFVGELISKLNRDSLPGMLDATWQESLKTPDPTTDPAHDFFNVLYEPTKPTDTNLRKVEHFQNDINIPAHRPYANY